MEIHILMAIQELHTPFLDFIFSHITALGNGGIFWILTGIFLFCLPKYRKQGFLLLLSLLVCFLVGNVLLKNLIARDRPCWVYPEIELLIKVPKDYSFPSGHTMTGIAAATAIWLTNKKWGIAAFILAGTIAFSRLYLFVHWPSDVLVAGIIGVLITLFVFGVSKHMQKGEEKLYENV